MAYLFDASGEVITATITAVDTGDWTLGMWLNPTFASSISAARYINISTTVPANTQILLRDAGNQSLRGIQNYSTTNALSNSNETLTDQIWSCIFATFRASDAKIRLYFGDVDSAVAECTYATQTAGVGTRTTSGVTARLANESTNTNRLFGREERVFFDNREWGLHEMEQFRLGRSPVQSGSLRLYLPLTSPTMAEDLSGNGANGTISGATAAEGPPVRMKAA